MDKQPRDTPEEFEPSSETPRDTHPTMADGWWWLDRAGERHGPCSGHEFDAAIADGIIGPQTKVWREGQDGWSLAREVVSLAPRFRKDMAQEARRLLEQGRETSERAGRAAWDEAGRLKGRFDRLSPPAKKKVFIGSAVAACLLLFVCGGPLSSGEDEEDRQARTDRSDRQVLEANQETADSARRGSQPVSSPGAEQTGQGGGKTSWSDTDSSAGVAEQEQSQSETSALGPQMTTSEMRQSLRLSSLPRRPFPAGTVFSSDVIGAITENFNYLLANLYNAYQTVDGSNIPWPNRSEFESIAEDVMDEMLDGVLPYPVEIDDSLNDAISDLRPLDVQLDVWNLNGTLLYLTYEATAARTLEADDHILWAVLLDAVGRDVIEIHAVTQGEYHTNAGERFVLFAEIDYHRSRVTSSIDRVQRVRIRRR